MVEGPGAPVEEQELQVAQAQESQQPPAAQTAPEPAPRQESTRETLPQTASPLALLLLGGVTSASFGLRLLRRS